VIHNRPLSNKTHITGYLFVVRNGSGSDTMLNY
jgi:hypothetical protein